MQPTLSEGDRLLVRYRARPSAGRLALVQLPPEPDGTARPIAVKRLSHSVEGAWWVDRDNRDEGVDSWQVGTLPASDVLAIVIGRIWPRPSLLRRLPGSPPRDADGWARR